MRSNEWFAFHPFKSWRERVCVQFHQWCWSPCITRDACQTDWLTVWLSDRMTGWVSEWWLHPLLVIEKPPPNPGHMDFSFSCCCCCCWSCGCSSFSFERIQWIFVFLLLLEKKKNDCVANEDLKTIQKCIWTIRGHSAP